MKTRLNRITLWLGFFAALLATHIYAEKAGGVREYQASMHEADWAVQMSVFECSISQQIPLFGEARFYHQAGETLQFELDSYERLISDDSINLRSVPPPWNFTDPVKNFGSLPVAREGQIEFDEALAKLLMTEMLTGMMPRLSGESLVSSFQSVAVTISPLRFQQAYESYRQCSQSLLPVNYAQVNRSTLFWPSGAKSLSAQAMQLLDNIVLYSQADDSIVGFEVDSFTDTAGERRDNLLLSEERAFLVTNYLIRQGIDPEKIATRAHGEREEYLIVNPEKTAADRNRNRRVNVVMLRGNPLLSGN